MGQRCQGRWRSDTAVARCNGIDLGQKGKARLPALPAALGPPCLRRRQAPIARSRMAFRPDHAMADFKLRLELLGHLEDVGR